MFGKRFAAAGICAVLAAGFLAGGTGLTAQAAVGDAAYTAAVNKAIIMSHAYSDELLSEYDFGATLAAELTGKKLQSKSESEYYDDEEEIYTHNITYLYDANGLQTAASDLFGSESYPAEGPTNCSITYDAAGYPTSIAVAEPTNYFVYYTWYNQIYQNTYDSVGRLSGLTRYMIRYASNPTPGETSSPLYTLGIAYDASGRISSITEKQNHFESVFNEDLGIEDYAVMSSSDIAFVFTYDAKNRIKSIDYSSVSSDGETSSSHNEYTYNRYGEVLTHTRVDSHDPTALAANEKYSYKQDGTLKKCTDLFDNRNVIIYNYQ